MHSIKDIRQNPELFKNELSKRFVEVDLKKILSLDEKNRKLIHDKETLEKEKKVISKNKDPSLFEKSKKISEQISDFIKEQSNIKIVNCSHDVGKILTISNFGNLFDVQEKVPEQEVMFTVAKSASH